MDIKERILELMRNEVYKPMDEKELLETFEIEKLDIGAFLSILDEMESEGKVIKTRKGKYGVPEKMNLAVGRLEVHKKGFGFVIPEILESQDVFISAENLNGAMNGDKVIARISKGGYEGKRAEGEIIRILVRANKIVVGTFEKSKAFGFVVPDDTRINMDVFISKSDFMGAKDGQKVIAEITRWPEKRRNPEGQIIEILGHKDDIGIDVLSIIKAHNLPQEFPKKVLEQAENIADTVSQEEIKNRRDLRNLKIVTIDGADAKDLDDAISIEKLDNGNYKLGVHIADVTYYVREGTPLDNEALKRGTSVYFADRVIPMLPPRLSNGICSLNPQVDRLTMSIFMEIDKNGTVVSHELFEGVIKTVERMTYTDVSDILEQNDPELMKRYEHVLDEFKLMEELFKILNKRRVVRGSIDFDFPEAKLVIDKEGKAVDVVKYERRVANRIIEEFMLCANETVAEHLYWANMPFVYRVHENPDAERLLTFNEFIHNLGYHLKGITDIHPKTLQELMTKVAGTKEEKVIGTLLLRSLKKARYSPENLGHFGLAAKYYCHFTSPIRRYPDLMIHRIIREFLQGKVDDKRVKALNAIVANAAQLSSEREVAAMEAEREVEDMKKAEYMQSKVGEEFEGIISSVTSFGFFVELENTIEGLVHVSSLDDDYYQFHEKSYSLIGERLKKTFRIGDVVKVKVAKADPSVRQIDFAVSK